MRICAISDTHGRHGELDIPPCDLLISAGDYSFHGAPEAVLGFHQWLNDQPAKHIISLQGNHEQWVEKNFLAAQELAKGVCPRVMFMYTGQIVIDGIMIWCSSYTPTYGCGWAYNADRGDRIKAHWDMIPNETDILVTHGPPMGILDEVRRTFAMGDTTEHLGCLDLLQAVKKIKPSPHFFGHIHGGYGQHHEDGTSFYNVSICDEMYRPINPVTIVDYIKGP
jgi:predicted phosphohydrolase